MKHPVCFFITLVCTCLLVSCAGMQTATIKRQDAAGLTVIVSGSTMGALDPEGCGCRMRGGLARKARYIQDARARGGALLVLDAGNFLADDAFVSKQALKTRAAYILKAFSYMQTDAVHVGGRDCKAGVDVLAGRGKKLSLPLTSATLQTAAPAEPLFAPYHIKKIGNRTVGIFGVSGEGPQGVTVVSPQRAAAHSVQVLKEKGCDVIIMLSQLSSEQNRNIARTVPGIHFIAGSSAAEAHSRPEMVGDTLVLSPGVRGEYLSVLELVFDNEGAPFYHASYRDEVVQAIVKLKAQEESPKRKKPLEDIVMTRLAMEEKLKALEAKNACRYRRVALDQEVESDPQMLLLVEKYKEEILKLQLASAGQTYLDPVPTISLEGLAVHERMRAARLINELRCRESGSIAQLAAKEPFCRNLGAMVVDRVKNGETDGKIQYGVLYQREKAQKKNSLDKPGGLH